MERKVFVSYDNWDIKTPFVSYNDEKFMQEINKKNINTHNKSNIVQYFKDINTKKKNTPYTHIYKMTLYFKNINANKKYKQHIHRNLNVEDSSKFNNNFCKALRDCFLKNFNIKNI
tara:strand:- start:246 stop:593 length:348 start_codon:yes stop_codon:yes gene_type:complete